MKTPITIAIKIIILNFVQFLFIVLTHTNCKYALIHCIFANAKNGSRTYAGVQAELFRIVGNNPADGKGWFCEKRF